MPAGSVVALFLKPAAGELVAVESLTAVEHKGFLGDRCLGSKERQALLVSTESLKLLGLDPGTLREQITVDFPGLQELAPGTVVKVGSVKLEITRDCEPCGKMARYLHEGSDEFRARSSRHRGMLANVLTDGVISQGDAVTVA